jgi:acetyl-CoA synthetase
LAKISLFVKKTKKQGIYNSAQLVYTPFSIILVLILLLIKAQIMSRYSIKNLTQYCHQYDKAKANAPAFWNKIARQNFLWLNPWTRTLEFDFPSGNIKWFEQGKLNITQNCLDRHLETNGNKTAIIFEPNNPNEPTQHISYQSLHERVCKMANVLLKQGIKKDDRVCIYLPMIPELPIAMLACARIGAIHTVVFAGFSAQAVAARINDCGCVIVITADGGYRGEKTIGLKQIIDEALEDCASINSVLVVNRTHTPISLQEGRDYWLQPLLDEVSSINEAVELDAEHPLFILYTSGSTGKPKGMVHTTGGYMVYTAYTFKNVFQYKKNDIFWCTADIGWITGHSYILYGPLLNAATTVLFEGIPAYPQPDRFWQIIDKHKVTQFYTAPTAIRSLAKEGPAWPTQHDLSSLKILGSVGEPINEEAWHWYDEHIGKGNCPITDTWWQTETGGILIAPIPFVTPTKPSFATLPLPGVEAVLLNDKGEKVKGNPAEGNLCMAKPWPGMARTIWGDHQRFIDTYFKAYPGYYFTGDGALRDTVGYYRITGRVDDVIIVSGHNLGTAPIESCINEHEAVVESAIVGFPHDVKGNALYAFVILDDGATSSSHNAIKQEINTYISQQIGAIAKLDKIQFVSALPKTRSGKIMRRMLRKVAEGDFSNFGDTSTLLNPEILEELTRNKV